MWLLLWHVRWRYEALIWSTTYVMWAAHAWPPDSPWSSYRFIDASCSVAARHGGFLTSVSTAGPLVVFLTRIFRQGFPARSLDSLLFWALVRALDELLIRPFGEAFLCIVLPLWLQFCGLIHLFSAYCGMRAHACHGVLHRPLWPPPCVVCKASASHRDLIPTRACIARPWLCGAWLCVASLICSMPFGGSRTKCSTTPQVDGQKLQYGAWLCAPQPNRPIVARPRGRVTIVNDADLPPHSPAPSVASSPPASTSAAAASVPAPTASVGPVVSVAPSTSGCDATVSAPLPAHTAHDSEHAARDNEAPYDPMLHPDVSDAMEDSLEVPNDCTLFADLDGMVQSAGLGPVTDVVDEAADALIRDVASSILGCVSASPAISATVVTTVVACSSPLPSASRPAPTCARRLSMPHVPEQDDFEAWDATQVQEASQAPPPQPLSVGLSSRTAPPRPNKRTASHSDPSKAKRSRPATRTTQAGMSSSNDSSAEAVRQPRRDQ
ncbi:hypothetical protein V6N12_033003 [Hibiscus sabdariffa]|uniref:Uncharacterized protein n=1 Tax=Hibiscus sabdariffa TaxID=183260 RepID=A0ABR2CF51_9ROSI